VKEIIIYSIVAIAGLTVFGYSIHMFIGGLVSPETESAIITVGCLIAAAAMAFMTWDVIKRRRAAAEKR
jgi:hypothetical protein